MKAKRHRAVESHLSKGAKGGAPGIDLFYCLSDQAPSGSRLAWKHFPGEQSGCLVNGMNQPFAALFDSWTKFHARNACCDGFEGPDERNEVDFRRRMLVSYDKYCLSLRSSQTQELVAVTD